MLTTTTYPPMVEALRKAALESIADCKTMIEAQYAEPVVTQESYMAMHRDYQQAIKPFVQILADCDRFAIYRVVISNDELATGRIELPEPVSTCIIQAEIKA